MHGKDIQMVNIQKPVLRFNEKELVSRKLSNIVLIILHHRCGDGDIESIHRQHLDRGWAGIGYHYYIRKDGTVFQGRPIEYIGAHCPNNNSKSIGICLEGDFRKEQPTVKQLTACKELIITLKKRVPSIKRVLNHNDLYKTLCPVVNLKEMVK